MYDNYWTLLEAAFERGDGYISKEDEDYLIWKAKRLGIPNGEYLYMCNYYHNKIMRARRREEEEDERRENEWARRENEWARRVDDLARREDDLARREESLRQSMSKRDDEDDEDEDARFIDELIGQSDNIERFEKSSLLKKFLVNYRRGLFDDDEEMLSDELDILLDKGADMGLDYRTVKQIINKYIPGLFS